MTWPIPNPWVDGEDPTAADLYARITQEINALAAADVRIASGNVTTGAVVANVPKSVAIVFPAGRFTVIPIVVVTAVTGAPGTIIQGVGVTGTTLTGATLWVDSSSALSGAGLNWVAVQNP